MLHNKLKEFRTSCALTQKQVADALKVDRSTYTCYETGKSQPPIDTLIKISKLFAVTIDEIVGQSNSELAVGTVSDNFSEYNNPALDISFANLAPIERELVIYYRMLENAEQQKFYEEIKAKNI